MYINVALTASPMCIDILRNSWLLFAFLSFASSEGNATIGSAILRCGQRCPGDANI